MDESMMWQRLARSPVYLQLRAAILTQYGRLQPVRVTEFNHGVLCERAKGGKIPKRIGFLSSKQDVIVAKC